MSSLPFGRGALIFIGCYLLFMLGLGYLAKRARRSESLSDFHLAGKNLGGFVLLLTLYATQYSGNTLLGYPGEAYRRGFVWIMKFSIIRILHCKILKIKNKKGKYGYFLKNLFT